MVRTDTPSGAHVRRPMKVKNWLAADVRKSEAVVAGMMIDRSCCRGIGEMEIVVQEPDSSIPEVIA